MSNNKTFDIQKAKAFPIEQLYDFGKVKHSRDKMFALCPFHKETRSSFIINKDKNTFHCFAGCGSGDSIEFVMKLYKKTFVEAVRCLSDSRERL